MWRLPTRLCRSLTVPATADRSRPQVAYGEIRDRTGIPPPPRPARQGGQKGTAAIEDHVVDIGDPAQVQYVLTRLQQRRRAQPDEQDRYRSQPPTDRGEEPEGGEDQQVAADLLGRPGQPGIEDRMQAAERGHDATLAVGGGENAPDPRPGTRHHPDLGDGRAPGPVRRYPVADPPPGEQHG